MATNAGSTIAASMLRARSAVISHFIDAGGTSAGNALTYQPQHHAERRALSYLLGQEVVRMTQEGRYWVDEEAARTWRHENGIRTAWMVGGALVAVAGLVAWRRYRGRQD